MRKGAIALVGLAGVAALAFLLAPKSASAASAVKPLEGGGPIDEGVPVQPANAAEAYALAMNPKMRDPEYVHQLALWLASSGQRPDWAAAAEKRAVDLRAELLLSEGLKMQTSLDQVENLGRQLIQTHPQYSTVLGTRIAVQRGANPPAPFELELASGGSLAIDMSIYRPASAAKPTATFVPSAAVAPAASVPVVVQTPVGPAQVSVPAPLAQAAAAAIPAVQVVAPPPPPVQAAQTPQQAATQAVQAATQAVQAVQAAAAAPQQVQVTLPPTATPLAHEEVKPANDPNGTIAMARVLLDEQATKNWKRVSEPLKVWQKKVGLTPDGKFGTGAALRMATEVMVVPFVRYFSLGIGDATKKAAVADYRDRMTVLAQQVAKKDLDHAAAILRAADLETGMGWDKTQPAAPAADVTPEVLAPYKRKLQGSK
jgi:hypothetical protein